LASLYGLERCVITGRMGKNVPVATVAELETCDGFTVEAPDGALGWVEETWLDAAGRPGAFAVRTADGLRALLSVDAVQAVDLDTQEVFVVADAVLLELAAPRIARLDRGVMALWRTTGATVEAVPVAAHAQPSAPPLSASRAATTRQSERPLAQMVAFALGCLAALIALEITLAFTIAYLVTGHPAY
jgi:hypothetical protein